MKFQVSVILPFGMMVLTSCADLPIIATQNDVQKVQASVTKMEEEVQDIKRNQAQYGARMDELNSNVLSVTGSVEDLVNTLLKRIESLERKLTGKVSQPQQPEADAKTQATTANKSQDSMPAKDIYDQDAYKDFLKGNYALAIMGFDALIKNDPAGALAQDAQYWKAECYFSQKKWGKAIEEFSVYAGRYAGSPGVRKAKYKQALALLELNNLTEAAALLDAVIAEFPLSDEAAQAKEKKKALLGR